MTESVSGTDDRADVQPDVGDPDVAGPDAPGGAPAAEQHEVRGPGRRRGLRSVLASPWLAWSVAVIALALAAFAGSQWADLHAAERTREEVARDATRLALRLTTFEGANIEEWYRQTRQTATGAYEQQLQQIFNQQTRDTLRSIEVVSRGEVEDLFVQDISGDEAKVFALVKQTYVNASLENPAEDHQRMEITLKRVNGRWLASDVAVLGPDGVVAPTAEASESAPDPGGDG